MPGEVMHPFSFAEMGVRTPQAFKVKHAALLDRRRALNEPLGVSGLHGPLAPLLFWNRVDRWSAGYQHRFDPFFGFDY
jgi:hypothetical protein